MDHEDGRRRKQGAREGRGGGVTRFSLSGRSTSCIFREGVDEMRGMVPF